MSITEAALKALAVLAIAGGITGLFFLLVSWAISKEREWLIVVFLALFIFGWPFSSLYWDL